MYKKLLISAGGGIISRGQQAQQNEAATIAIGLGGMGIDCLRALKKEVYNRLEPDDDKALVPNYKHIKFLAIDTDESSLRDYSSINTLDGNTEFIDLSCNNIGAVPKNIPSLTWLSADSINISDFSMGAGGIRQIGRLLLFAKCNSFISKIKELIMEAREDLMNGVGLNIHIFTGMSGGTGSGIFLDVCYLVQYILDSMGIRGTTHTYGYFFLPDVNISRVNDNARQYIKSNGFAAMKELDYCMNFELNGGEWKQTYDGFEITSKEPPVKLAYLITATNSDGSIMYDPYNYAINVVVEHVMCSFVEPNIFALKDIHAAGVAHSVKKEHGAGYCYCILGASSAYIPYKEITTYLTSKIFEEFAKIDHKLPSDNDIDLFIQTTGLRYEDLCRELRANVPTVPLYEVDPKVIWMMAVGLTPTVIPQVLGQMRDSLSRIGGQVAENKKNMLQASEESDERVPTLISRVRRKIVDISQQPDKGPYYGGAILHSVKARDLQNRIDGYIEQNNRNLNNARSDMALRDHSVAQTLRDLQNSNALNRKNRVRAYVQAVHAYFRQQADIEFYTTLGEILFTFKRQISDLYTQEFAIFETVMRNLEATFAENLIMFANPITESRGYAVKLVTIQDLKDSLDASVKEMRIDDLFSGFVNYMLNDKDMWIAQDENKVTRVVSNFFLNALKQYTARTMDDYLRYKYAPNHLGRIIPIHILTELANKSKPLFWTDTLKFRIQHNTKLIFLTIPNESHVIQEAANCIDAVNENIRIRPSYCTDRISFLVFDCAIPMYAYKGVDNYKDVPQGTGAYLYEGTAADPRDWRKLWNITPLSCITENNMSEDVAELKEMLDLAEQKGILRAELDGAIIVEYDEETIKKVGSKVDTLVSEGDVNKCKMFLIDVEKIELPIKSKSQVSILGVNEMELQNLIAKDLIAASPKFTDMISCELAKVTLYEESIKKLKLYIQN